MHRQVLIIVLVIWLPAAATADGGLRNRTGKAIESALLEVGRGALGAERTWTCNRQQDFTVYLIDNFDQRVSLVPEVSVSHGELVRAILVSGRNDLHVVSLNTSLTQGLAKVVHVLLGGQCIDAVVSSVPGSNYSYDQVSTLLGKEKLLHPANLLEHRKELLDLLVSIAFHGFPSVEWLEQADVNPVKLREDAVKIAFIDALATVGIPVYLPYGNGDTLHNGEKRDINLLSISDGAKVYAGVDRKGERLPHYPSSPLQTGKGLAFLELMECPDTARPEIAHLDVNGDGAYDFSYNRDDLIAYFDERGDILYAPPPVSQADFRQLLAEVAIANEPEQQVQALPSVVITADQYAVLRESCKNCLPSAGNKQLVWLNSERYEQPYQFNPQCRRRGAISGSSLIPPAKASEQLKYHTNRKGLPEVVQKSITHLE